jgi:uncharacterized membrane protein
MTTVKIATIMLIVAGVLGLEYGSFHYTTEIHEATRGFIDLSVNDMQAGNVSALAGVGAIVIGGVKVLFGNKKSW